MQKLNNLLITSPSFCKDSQLVESASSLASKIILNSKGEKWGEEELIKIFTNNEIDSAIIGTELFTRKVVNATRSLKVVSKYGVGLDNIDQEALSDRNIAFYSKSGVNKRSVSELVLAFALGHLRNVSKSMVQMSQGNWIKYGGSTLSGKTIGIVGFGHIGQDLATLLQAFECEILYFDIQRHIKLENSKIRFSSYDEILKLSDVITFHVPSTRITRHMFSMNEIKKVKSNVLIINTARGDICKFEDVCFAVKQKLLAGYASDVFPEEPWKTQGFDIVDGFYFTPHIGGSASEAIKAMGLAAIEGLESYLNGRPPV
jgi:phosphoglycerate dehydrogenase-like enzyme